MATEDVYVNVEEMAEWTGPDEHIYMSRDSKKSVAAPSVPSDEPRAHRRAVWAVVIGLLSALLLAALIFIVLTMKMWTNERDGLQERNIAIEMSNHNLSAQIRLLKEAMKMWTNERDGLQERHIAMEMSNHNLSAQIRLLKEDIGTLDGDQNKLRKELQGFIDMILCPKKWVKLGYSCYLLSQNAKNWMDSKQECEELGASLVIISSPEEQTFVSGLSSQSVWIGLTDRETEGVWRWVNGDAVTTSHWRPGEPNNSREEDCGEISGKDKLWNDIPCSVKQSFICEKFLQL